MIKITITIFFYSSLALSDSAIFFNKTLNGKIPIQNWKNIRNSNLIKQNKDYSCGASSIATILNEYYNHITTEDEILSFLDKGNNRASFKDMESALLKIGYKTIGLATSWEQLIKLKIPVILYVKQRKNDHFTVLSGISDTHVKLSDPSLGNKILTRGQFKKIWNTRPNTKLSGKMLAIVKNKNDNLSVNEDFFTAPTFSKIPTSILSIRKTL